MNKTEQCSDRYMEAEKLLLSICQEPWWKLFFVKRKIFKFLMSRDKYKF